MKFVSNKTDLRIIKTKKSIYRAFFKLLNEKGFEKISVKDISDEAVISRNTFYLHYEDKYDLMDKICDEMVTALFENVNKKIENYAELSLNVTVSSITKVLMLANEVISENEEMYTIMLKNDNSYIFKNKLRKKLHFYLSPIFNNADGLSEYNIQYIIGGIVNITIYRLHNKIEPINEQTLEAFVRLNFSTYIEYMKNYGKQRGETQ